MHKHAFLDKDINDLTILPEAGMRVKFRQQPVGELIILLLCLYTFAIFHNSLRILHHYPLLVKKTQHISTTPATRPPWIFVVDRNISASFFNVSLENIIPSRKIPESNNVSWLSQVGCTMITSHTVDSVFVHATPCFPYIENLISVYDVQSFTNLCVDLLLQDNPCTVIGLANQDTLFIPVCAMSAVTSCKTYDSQCLRQRGVNVRIWPDHFPELRADLCIVITPIENRHDPLKQIAYKNTAIMYGALRPRIQAFLVPMSGQKRIEWWPWGIINHHRIETNPFGTPTLVSLLEQVALDCPHAPLIAYANADILFDDRMLPTVDGLLAWNQTGMLAVGHRLNHNLEGSISIRDINKLASEKFSSVAQDYFIVSRDVINIWRRELPPYVIGRRAYDNALVDWAYHNAKLVDLTETVTALHQTTSDGNFAGHSSLNADKEYNVGLPGAQYDHGSIYDSQYYTTEKNRTVTVRKKGKDFNIVYQRGDGQVINADDLPNLLFVTFGNHAYKEMLASFICNTAVFPDMHKHMLIIVTDHATSQYLQALKTDVIIGLHESHLQSGHDYDTPEYVELMLLRGHLLLKLLGPRVIVWLEADAEYRGNLLTNDQITSSESDLTLYWDGAGFGGGFIRFAASEPARSFYEEIVTALETGIEQKSFTNDQVILNKVLATTSINYTVFDRCLFRSGLYYRETVEGQEYRNLCKGTKAVAQQHNWIIGNNNKIELAKQHGAWFLDVESPFPACRKRDLRIIVMTLNRPASLERLLLSLKNAVYPPNAIIDLQISVDHKNDAPPDAATLGLIRDFEWQHGIMELNIWKDPAGIFGQWVDSWPCEKFPPWLYGASIFFEDDLEVSSDYYFWFTGAHQAYASPSLGAVTGMRPQLVAKTGINQPISALIPSGIQVFAYRLIATWSMSPTYEAWKKFRMWVKDKVNSNFDPGVPGTVPGQWYRDFLTQGREKDMWEIWFLRFMHDENLYTLYPWIEDGKQTIVCNWREKGLHFDGIVDSGRDFPLTLTLPPDILNQQFVPYVDWGLEFYYCLVGPLYGNQVDPILAVSWAQHKAKEIHKFLRLAELSSLDTENSDLLRDWGNIFDPKFFHSMLIDGINDERCALHVTFEETYRDMLMAKGHGMELPYPKKELISTLEQSRRVRVSVHGESFQESCEQSENLCTTFTNESLVEDMCDYRKSKIVQMFNISQEIEPILFTDGLNPALDATYTLVDSSPLLEQIWPMVTSDVHIGNPKSSVDFAISLWRKQLGVLSGTKPEACYA